MTRAPSSRKDSPGSSEHRTRTAAGETPRSASATSARPRCAGQHSSLPARNQARSPAPPGAGEPQRLADAIAARYGDDHTFSVPILTVLAVAGRVTWQLVP